MKKVMKDLIKALFAMFLQGLVIIGLIAVIILPLILTFYASGLIRQIALVLLIIEVVIGIGFIGEWLA